MRRALAALLLVVAWTLPAFAGDFTMPGERGKVRARASALSGTFGVISSTGTIATTDNGTLSITAANGTISAFTVSGTGHLRVGSGSAFDVLGAGAAVQSTSYFGIGSGAATGTIDTLITRKGAANWQLGNADAAAPVAQTLSVQSVVAGTSNTAGTNWTLKGSAGTGTGTGGSLIFQTAPAGTTGTAQNAQQTALTIDQKSHVGLSSAAVPTIGTCGTGSPAVTAGSTDNAGEFTIGTTATACTLTFKQTFAAAPFCVLTDKTATVRLLSYTISTSALVLTMTSNSGDVVDYLCSGI